MSAAASPSQDATWLARSSRPLLLLSACIGAVAVLVAGVHMWRQARAGTPHIDHVTPLALMVASMCKLPHSLLVHDYAMLAFQGAFAMGWFVVFLASLAKPR